MAITWQATDTIEPAADTDIEQAANAHLYGVISGCPVTFDAADMTYDVGAGTILHNGSVVSVSAQANAGTLVADGTNPRWAYIYLDSTGTEGLTHGTAAADPAKPEIGDNVAIAAVLIAAGATIASSQTTLDKRVWTHYPTSLVKYMSATQVFTTNTTYADLVTSGSGTMSFPVVANGIYVARVIGHLTFGGTGGVKFQVTGPAAPTAVSIEVYSAQYQQTHASGTDPADITLLYNYLLGRFTAFSSGGGASSNSVSGAVVNGPFAIDMFIQNGANAGTVTVQAAQFSSNSTTTFAIGTRIEARLVG